MKKSFGVQTFLYPMPVLMIASYDENDVADVMVAAWGGIHDTNQIGVCISPEHKTAKNIMLKKAFTVSLADEKHIKACDYLGLVSANKEPDKVKKSGFTLSRAEKVDAPVINELSVAIECKLLSYDEKTGCAVADIVNVSAEEDVLTDGKIDISKIKPVIYNPVNHSYVKSGETLCEAFKSRL